MMTIAPTRTHRTVGHRVIGNPRLVRYLFETTRSSWLWLVIRVYLGYQWLNAGWGKFKNPAWMETGEALKGYFTNAVKVDPRPVITYDWYRNFIQGMIDSGAYAWFAKVVVFGEMLVGLALILGFLTGFAALGGALMNFNFMLAGTTSTNPVLFLLAVFIILAWKVAGHWGADRWMLPLLGTPWQPDTGPRAKPETGKDE